MADTATATATELKNTYEAMFLLGPAAGDAEKALGLCRGAIERHGGEVLVIKKWDERKLAYEVQGQKRGTYVIAFFNAPGANVTAFERDVRLSDEILRVMVLKADHLNPEEMAAVEPQPIQPREERSFDRPYGDRFDRPRDDRGDRGDRPPRDDRGGDRGGERPARPPRPAAGEPTPDKD